MDPRIQGSDPRTAMFHQKRATAGDTTCVRLVMFIFSEKITSINCPHIAQACTLLKLLVLSQTIFAVKTSFQIVVTM